MNLEPSGLAERLEACELDDAGAADPLSQRLARENGWSREFALRVLSEYKRFLLLAMTADHVVTPSEQVDQAWHQHLLYTARYRRFCRNVLGRRLDHNPSSGGAEERARYVAAYELTLASYERSFGEPAPSDIWPSSERRFGEDLRVSRVNVAAHWVVPKPKPWRWLETKVERSSGRMAVATAALAGVGCAGDRTLPLLDISGPAFLQGYLALWLLTLVTAYVVRKLRWAATSDDVPVLEPYRLALLAGGDTVALHSAITALIAREVLAFDSVTQTLRIQRPLYREAAELERDVYAVVERAGELPIQQLREQAPKLTETLATQLHAQGLTTTTDFKLPFWLALAAPVVGCGRIVSRLGTDKPIAFLVGLTIIGLMVAYWVFRPRLTTTPLGDAALAAARGSNQALRTPSPAGDLATAGTLPIAFALFGLGALALPDTGWASSLTQYAASSPKNSSGGGCGGGGCGGGGGGCSGGGCGGGCGGCGGGGCG